MELLVIIPHFYGTEDAEKTAHIPHTGAEHVACKKRKLERPMLAGRSARGWTRSLLLGISLYWGANKKRK
jgi:hypothetical protein